MAKVIEIRTRRRARQSTVLLSRSGREIPIDDSAAPIRVAEGELFDVILVIRDVTEQKRSEHVGASKIARDVSRQKKSERLLRESDRRKDEFLATLGHELRNPLAPIRNVAEVLCRIAGTHPESQVACEILRRQVRVMTHLVDDLLDVSRITSGRLRLRQETIELLQLLLNTVESLRHAFEAKRQLIGVSLAGETLAVLGDRTRLTQIFSNLLNNANKYTQEGGHIDVELTREGGDALVRVRDDGMGIPAAMLDDIFELFAQVPRTRIGSDSGLGIGLTLAKRITELHHGSIEARSAGEGRGSEFVVRLPLADSSEPSAGTPVSADPPPGGLKILIADDNKDSAVSLAMLLTTMGHEARVVHDGEAAVLAADEFQPSVIFLDLAMPKLNGYEAARQIAQQPWARATRLVALTGWGQPSDLERSRAAGFHRHLVKPVEMDVLTGLLESAAKE